MQISEAGTRAISPGTEKQLTQATGQTTGIVRRRSREGAVYVEAAALALLVVGMTLALRPVDAGLLISGPHPIWLAVLVISARYGTRGFAVGVLFGAAALGGVAGLLHLLPEAVARLDAGTDFGGLMAALVVGWIASIHVGRTEQLTEDLVTTRRRARANHAAAGELKEAVRLLRARADRLDTSLTFMSDVAERMDTGDATAAAQAAVDLALARLGARAAVVQLQGDRPLMLARSGAWAPDAPTPDLTGDRTVKAALARRRTVRGLELSGAGAGDSDLAAPLLMPDDTAAGAEAERTARTGAGAAAEPLGVIAVRGVPQAGADPALVHDLGVIAQWLSRALLRQPATARLLQSAEHDDEDHYAKVELLPLPARSPAEVDGALPLSVRPSGHGLRPAGHLPARHLIDGIDEIERADGMGVGMGAIEDPKEPLDGPTGDVELDGSAGDVAPVRRSISQIST